MIAQTKKPSLLFLVAVFFGLASLLYVAATSAQSANEPTRLFEPVGAERVPARDGALPSSTTAAVREQEIRVNFGPVNFAEARELSLPLIGGLSYTAVRSESEGFAASPDGGLVWRGKISGPGEWSGDVTLSAKGRALSGLIYSPEGVYEIVPQKDFGHLLVQLDQSLFPPCAGALPAGPAPEAAATDAAAHSALMQPAEAVEASTAADDGSVIDVLIVYTTNARISLGGVTQAEAFALEAVSTTNTAYINSDIHTRLRLVGTLEVAYAETGDLTGALRWAADDATINATRNSKRADMVAFIVERGSGCGVGWLMSRSSVGQGFSPRAYSATVLRCAVGNLTFAHELGHNQGCHHNPENGGSPEDLSFPYAFGHYVDGSFRTIMSYSDPCTPPNFCPRIPYFSNPSVNFQGVPTGVADQRDNRRVINNTAPIIAKFRETFVADPPPNDNFASALALGGAAGVFRGSNNGSTKEPGEPNHGFRKGGASLWFSWQAPADGSTTVTTVGSTFNTLLSVYTGGGYGGLTVVAHNDDVDLAAGTSGVTFNATAGTTYLIAVDGHSGATGSLRLGWSQGSACAYTISPASQSFTAEGGAGSVSVTAVAGCGWAASGDGGFVQITGGNSGTGDGTVSYSVAANPGSSPRSGTLTIAGQSFTVNQAGGALPAVQLSSPAFTVNEPERKVLIGLTRTGDISSTSTVNYATADGTASRLSDYTQTQGTLSFAAGEATKTVTVFVTDDAFEEPDETFTFTLLGAAEATPGTTTAAVVTINSDDATNGANPVGDAAFKPDFFVRQHYVDFLGREPDPGGLAFWAGQTTDCGSPNFEVCRVNVSAAFFLSIEFQNTGYLVYRFHKAAYGDATSPNVAGTVPAMRLEEFLADTQRIGQGVVVNQGDWQAQLESNKQAYALEFVQRQRFLTAYPANLPPAQFVEALRTYTGSALSEAELNDLVAELTANNTTAGRASVLRRVAEDADLQAAERDRAFVLMQYFGYLRRNPDDAPDSDFRGWRFWLDKLNQFGGTLAQAGMVKAFVGSAEDRLQFIN